MANYRHLETLRQGVAVWNDWRACDSEIKPNLSEANLIQCTLVQAQLKQTDLRKADLRKANLSQSDLRKADLRNANLRGAQLVEADLRGANLSGATFINADLSKADLRGADLRHTNLTHADLYEVDLRRANLSEALLKQTHMVAANLKNSNLRAANLIEAVMVIANLAGADLSLANLTGARLYGTARDEWKIDGVKCDYAYWGGTGKTRTPTDRNYRPGEFEMLYRQLPSVEYLFEEGFTPLCAVLMDKVVRTINEQHPDLELSLDSLILRGIPRAIFSVLHKEDCPRALELVTNLYHDQSNWIEDKYTTLKECYQEITARLQ